MEKNKLFKCSICEEYKPRILKEAFRRVKIFVNDKGKYWDKSDCPDCVALDPPMLTTRRCRDCRNLLPPSRYFKCHKCQPQLPSTLDDAVFTGDVATAQEVYGACDLNEEFFETVEDMDIGEHDNENSESEEIEEGSDTSDESELY